MSISSSNAPRTLRLSPSDNVVVALDPIEAGTPLAGGGAVARGWVPRGHKVAAAAIAEGAPIVKLGQIIGFAAKPIAPGEWVHEHNVGLHAFARDHRAGAGAPAVDRVPEADLATFQGFRRADGRAGTRNYIGVASSVNCSATVARLIAQEVERSGILAGFPNIDGVVALVHGTGCGMASRGEGFDLLQRTLWGYVSHPNFGAVLLVGLGCEVLQIGRLKAEHGLVEGDRFRTMTIQDSGGTRRTVEAGVARIKEMLPLVDAARRETIPAAELVLGLQCGASDGYSGITANPALGAAADLLVRRGGTAILSSPAAPRRRPWPRS